MRKTNQYRRLILFLSAAVLVFAQSAVFACGWHFVYNTASFLEEPFSYRGTIVLIGLYAVISIMFYKLFGCFRVGYHRVYDSLFNQLCTLIGINIFAYLLLCLACRWEPGENWYPMVVMTLVDMVIVIFWSLLGRFLYLLLSPPRELLLIYGDYRPDNLMNKLASRPDKYQIKEAISMDTDFDEMTHKISQHGSVVLTDIPSQLRNDLLKYCFANDIRCYCVPKISDIMVMNATELNLFDTSLLLMRNSGMSGGQKFAKRLFDIVVSLIGIVIASPFMLIIALCVKLYDGGPVLFRQERLTQNGKVFQVLKFRSMRVDNGKKDYCMTRKNDSRITPVGKIIRNIHFDELPQLFNILKGDMSIVGPRPECPQLAEEYRQFIPEFNFRLKVKAGLTGYAQVYGKYNTTPYDKLKLDLTYIEKYSFLLDLQLILMTIKILFQKENTEGIESWQKSAATEDNLEQLVKQ